MTAPLMLPGVRTGLSVQEGIVHIVCPKPPGEMYFWYERVGQPSLCSQALLLPFGVPPTPAPAMPHMQSSPRP